MAQPAGEEERRPWTRLCHVVLTAGELFYLDWGILMIALPASQR